MHNLSFSLNGSDGALEITSPGGLLVARLTPVEQLEIDRESIYKRVISGIKFLVL